MKSNYIKLNNNLNYLSLGNFFNIIKNNAKNKNSAIQTEIFCAIFNTDTISDTTVGNYCTGYRAIGSEYKQIYLNYQKKWKKDKKTLVPIINNIISILEGYICEYNISEINNSKSLKKICNDIHILVKNDIYVPSIFKKEYLNLITKENYYDAICNILFYIILEKKQPLYETDIVISTIEDILKNTNMSINDLKDYLEISFKEGITQVASYKKLALKNNPYALYELGKKEYNGEITGYPRYEEAYNYFLKAADFNHPSSNWMISYMILNKKIGSLQNNDLKLAWTYLNKAISLNSISAINTQGLCYMLGLTPNHKKNLEKAKELFEKAASKKYIYAYNNLGRLYEMEKNFNNAYSYFLKSANEEESWACNKIGIYYFNGIGTKKDIKKAFYYFNLGKDAPIGNRNPWNTYNLVKLFYMKGNTTIGIKKDLEKSIELLNTLKDFNKANELYLYIYYEKYLNDKNEKNLDKLKYYLNLANNETDIKYKQKIEKELKQIKDYNIKINL